MIAAVEEEGEALRAEFYRPEGPRGHGGDAPIDAEMEERLRTRLQALVPCAYGGEETGMSAATKGGHEGWLWLVDPQDGTYEFLNGRRGSAISVALLRDTVPVLAVVHAPFPPDRGPDTIAWAEGAPLTRNGKPVESDFKQSTSNFGWATASSAARPITFSVAMLPARYVAMPSIAYRLARIAAGDGAATLSTHPVNEYDIAAGLALVLAAGGAMVDLEGRDIALAGDPERRVTGCFAGNREMAVRLSSFSWKLLDEEPKRTSRVALGFPRRRDDLRLARATGCLLGQVIGDSLCAAADLHLLPGQPTDDSEMALALCRSMIKNKDFRKDAVLDDYRIWLQSRPVEVGETTERGLLGLHTGESESHGSLMRASPLGVWAAGDPARAAAAAREDSALTHPNQVCIEACAGYCAAIAAGIGGGDRKAMLEAALANCSGPARDAIAAGASGKLPADFKANKGSALAALQASFFSLFNNVEFEKTTLTAMSGALLGAAHGRDAIPPRWILQALACRPLAEAGALRPRPMDYWPDDVLEVAEALLEIGDVYRFP